MEISDDSIEQIGQLADKADNFVAASNLPLSPEMHAKQLRRCLADISFELKAIVVAVTGNNPWEMHPK